MSGQVDEIKKHVSKNKWDTDDVLHAAIDTILNQKGYSATLISLSLALEKITKTDKDYNFFISGLVSSYIGVICNVGDVNQAMEVIKRGLELGGVEMLEVDSENKPMKDIKKIDIN